MVQLDLETDVVDPSVYARSIARFRDAGIILPTFAELAEPDQIPAEIRTALAQVDPDAPHPLNLFRVHWHIGPDRRTQVAQPEFLVLPPELTGVPARIVVLLGNRFPMIRAHKVLAAYGCLAPRIITGQFDPTAHKALWPSTGNYCRGGVAISRILGCRGVAILPEGMSRERFDWLEDWVSDPADIVRTPGCESNVKEIYDKCHELDAIATNVIFNQFSEFANHLVHYRCTGTALWRAFEAMRQREPDLQLRAFVSATGSAGTIAAGDFLKDRCGSKTVAVEAAECPTMLDNGFGDHNIQGIGDKHIPLIHNLLATDLAIAVSERSTDQLGLLFNTAVGREYLTQRRGIAAAVVHRIDALGLSSIGNLLAAIATAKYFELGPDDVVMTVATDGAEMYGSERDKTQTADFPAGFDPIHAGEVFGEHLRGGGNSRLLELSHRDRNRIFNLGYFTWVEQQGVTLEQFEARRDPTFWRKLRDLVPAWDQRIDAFNAATGLRERP